MSYGVRTLYRIYLRICLYSIPYSCITEKEYTEELTQLQNELGYILNLLPKTINRSEVHILDEFTFSTAGFSKLV